MPDSGENRTSITGLSCQVGDVVQQAIQALRSRQADLSSEKGIIDVLKNSTSGLWSGARSSGTTLAATLFGDAANDLYGFFDDVSSAVQLRRNQLEHVLNMLYNIDTEGVLAVSQLVIDRMLDQIGQIHQGIHDINKFLDSLSSLIRALARAANALGRGSMDDIAQAEKVIKRATEEITIVRNHLVASGFVLKRDVTRFNKSLVEAARILDRKSRELKSLSITKDGEKGTYNISLVVPEYVQRAFSAVNNLVADIPGLLLSQSRIMGAYRKLLQYRSMLLKLPENIQVVQAGAASGLYGKLALKLIEETAALDSDMKAFTVDSRSVPNIQMKRIYYLNEVRKILETSKSGFGDLGGIDKTIRRIASYQRLRSFLESEEFFTEKGEKIVESMTTHLHITVARMEKLAGFDTSQAKSIRKLISEMKRILEFTSRKVTVLESNLKSFGPHYSQEINFIFDLLNSLGVGDPLLIVAGGQILDMVTSVVDVNLSLLSTSDCLSNSFGKLNVVNPESQKKLQSAASLKDQMEGSQFLAVSEEARLTVFQGLDDYSNSLERKSGEIDAAISSAMEVERI